MSTLFGVNGEGAEPPLRKFGCDDDLDKPLGDGINFHRFAGNLVFDDPSADFGNHGDSVEVSLGFVNRLKRC